MSLLPPAYTGVGGYPGRRGVESVPGQGRLAPGTRNISIGALDTTVNSWSSAPSNALVTSSHVVKPWSSRNYHTNMREGHMLFVYRAYSPQRDDPKTIVNLPDFNDILRRTYLSAVEGRMLESAGMDFDPDTVNDRLHQEPTIDELFYRTESAWIGQDRYKGLLESEDKSRSRLRYLTQDGILNSWNYLGVQAAQSANTQYKVIAVANTGPVELTNVFSSHLSPRAPLSLILKRYYNRARGEYEHFYMCPWTSPDGQRKVPSLSDLAYEDISGHQQYGHVINIGFVRHMGNKPADEGKRQQAINVMSGQGTSANDALGSLPNIEAILTNPARAH